MVDDGDPDRSASRGPGEGSAVHLTASLVLMPAGMAVAGLAAEAFGANAVLVVAAVVAVAVPLLTLQVRGVATFGAAGISAEA